MGNYSGGSGGRIKYKEELPLPCNPQSQLASSWVMSRKDKDWLLKSYLCSLALADRNWRHLRWQVPSEQCRHQPSPLPCPLPSSFHRSWPTFSLAQMVPSWLGVWHLCSLVFSHTTRSAPLPALLFSLGPEPWEAFLVGVFFIYFSTPMFCHEVTGKS